MSIKSIQGSLQQFNFMNSPTIEHVSDRQYVTLCSDNLVNFHMVQVEFSQEGGEIFFDLRSVKKYESVLSNQP